MQRHYYISGLTADTAGNLAHRTEAVRSHWGIKNRVHWVLGLSFGEDASRIHKGHGPENVGVLRRIALNLVRKTSAAGACARSESESGGTTPTAKRSSSFR